jgi:hypothetical protein
LDGYLEVKTDGYYTFRLGSAGKSELFLSDRLLLSNDIDNSQGPYKSYMVPLTKGFYHLRIVYLQKQGSAFLSYPYVSAGTDRSMTIPKELLYAVHL